MRKVRITQGTYGYKPDGARHVSPKNRRDEPFLLPDAEAARIVGLGIAEYVSGAVATAATPPAAPNPNAPNGGTGDAPETPEYSSANTVAELRAIGKGAGLTFKVGMSKQQMLDALDAYYSADSDDDGADPGADADDDQDEDQDDETSDDEDAPNLSHEDPVV